MSDQLVRTLLTVALLSSVGACCAAWSYSFHASPGNDLTLGLSYVRGPAITPRVADTLTFTASWGLYF